MKTKAEIEAMTRDELKAYLEGVTVGDLKESLQIVDELTLKVGLEAIDRPALKLGLEAIDRPTLKVGLEAVNRETLKVGLESINQTTLKQAIEIIDRPTLWEAVNVINAATLNVVREIVDSATNAVIQTLLSGPLGDNIDGSPQQRLPDIENRLRDILSSLSHGNEGEVNVAVTLANAHTIHFEAKIRSRHKVSGNVIYDISSSASGDIDIQNPSSVKDIQVCADLPPGLGRACATLEQLVEIIMAIS